MQARMRYIGPSTLTAKQRFQSSVVVVATGAIIVETSFMMNINFRGLFFPA